MKHTKIFSIILSTVFVFFTVLCQVAPAFAGIQGFTKFGPFTVSYEGSLSYTEWRWGEIADYDVHYKNNTLYVNTSKYLTIDVGDTTDKIVFEHDANAYLYYYRFSSANSYPAIEVKSGKTVNLTLASGQEPVKPSIHNNAPAIKVDGTLNLTCGNNNVFENTAGYAIEGNGTLNIKGGTLTAIGGIRVRNLTCDSSTLTASASVNGGAGITTSNDGGNISISKSNVTATGKANIGIGSIGKVLSSLNIANSNVTAKGGNGFSGIGVGGSGCINALSISNSVVTAAGGSGASCDIGGGTVNSFKVDSNSTVKGSTNISVKDTSGNSVSCQKIDNLNVNSVFINGNLFPFRDHNGEKAVYPYVKNGVNISFSNLIYAGDFVIEPLSSKFPTDGIIFDKNNPDKIIINTSEPLSISNANPGATTNQRIFISKTSGANITFNGVNISSSGSPVEIETEVPVTVYAPKEPSFDSPTFETDFTIYNREYIEWEMKSVKDNPKNVRITLKDGSINRLVATGNNASAIKKIYTIDREKYYDPGCGTLTIDGKGTLILKAGSGAAAIGGTKDDLSKKLTIKSGSILLFGGNGSPAVSCDNFKVYSGAQLYCSSNTGSIAKSAPKNENGAVVYPFVTDICGDGEIIVDNIATGYKGNEQLPEVGGHAFFLTGTNHLVEIGAEKTHYKFNGTGFEKAPHTWSQNWEAGRDSHVKFCMECGQILKEAHVLPAKWESDENGHYKICTICGEKCNESAHGSFTSTHDPEGHYEYCGVCGKLVNTSEHKLSDWKYSERGNTEDGHYIVCTECNEIIEKEPHEFSDYEYDDSFHYKTCKICGLTVKHSHSSEEWQSDQNGHYRICLECGAKYCEDPHMRSANPDERDTSCAICGYSDNSRMHFLPGSIISAANSWIIIASAIVVIGAIVAIVFAMKKRKSNQGETPDNIKKC